MKIKNISNPFFHCIISEFYNKDEEKLIWQELDFLNKNKKLLPPHMTGDSSGSSPNKKGAWLNHVYKNQMISNIFSINKQKISTLKKILPKKYNFEYFTNINSHKIMLSYYENQSLYLPHRDLFVLSSVTTFWKTPKKFNGGELTFNDHNYCPKMKHNTMIIFPSCELHSVSEISMEDNDGINGRYSINQFFSILDNESSSIFQR